MHILMLTEFFLPFERGGSEQSISQLSRALVKKKHAVEIFTPNYGADSTSDFNGIKIFRFPYYLKIPKSHSKVSPFHQSHIVWWLWTLFCLVKRIKLRRPDVIHVQGKYFIPQAVIAGKIFNIPVVVTLRDYIVLCPHAYCLRENRAYKKCSLFELLRIDLPIYYKQFHIVTNINKLLVFFGTIHGWVVSLFLQYFLKKADRMVGISNKLSLIYRKNNFSVNKTIYNTFTGVPLKKRSDDYILFVGRKTEGKGFPLLLSAYSELTNKDKPPLFIIGDDSLITSQSDDSVKNLGYLTYQSTLKYISRAILVIVPAVWDEPFGRVALEATMLGVPVIASSRGGLPEIVEDNVTGLIVEPNVQSLVRGISEGLQKSAQFRKNIYKNLPQLRKKFGSYPVSQYEKLYQKLL